MYQARHLTQVARRRRSGWLVGFFSVFAFTVMTAAVYLGYLVFRDGPVPTSPPAAEAENPADVAPEPVHPTGNGIPEPGPKVPAIKAETEIVYEYRYPSTGKTRREVGSPFREMIGLTEEGLRRVYPQYEVKEFSEDRVVLIEEIPSTPDTDTLAAERRIYRTIKDKDGVVAVFAGRPGPGMILLRSTEIRSALLPKEARDMLNKGLVVKGDGEVARYLEGLDE